VGIIHPALYCEMRDGKKNPRFMFVSDAMASIAAGCHGCGGTAPPSVMYIAFAGGISIDKNRIASSAYSTISCRNSPRRQLKFAIGYNNSSLTAMHHAHPCKCLPCASAFRDLSIMSVMGSAYSTNNFTCHPRQPCFPRQKHWL
jgi:hypothetical protein